jgi:glucokinase
MNSYFFNEGIGAGTGLGQCYLTPSGDDMASGDYRCFPSEGGHADFAPRNEVNICHTYVCKYDM